MQRSGEIKKNIGQYKIKCERKGKEMIKPNVSVDFQPFLCLAALMVSNIQGKIEKTNRTQTPLMEAFYAFAYSFVNSKMGGIPRSQASCMALCNIARSCDKREECICRTRVYIKQVGNGSLRLGFGYGVLRRKTLQCSISQNFEGVLVRKHIYFVSANMSSLNKLFAYYIAGELP